MEIKLSLDMFRNNRLTVRDGDWEVLFIIVDEEFPGDNNLGRVNRMVILARKYDSTGKEEAAALQTTVIGLRAGIIGIRSDNPALRGKLLNKDNMEECTVILYGE